MSSRFVLVLALLIAAAVGCSGGGGGGVSLTVSSALPAFDDVSGRIGQAPGSPRNVVAFDADGDGDLDLYLPGDGPDRLLLNDGVAGFIDAPPASLPPLDGLGQAAAVADADGDGDLEVFVATGPHTAAQVLTPVADAEVADGSVASLVLPAARLMSFRSASHSEGLLKFDLAQLPSGIPVGGGRLDLFHQGPARQGGQFGVYRNVDRDFVEATVTWNLWFAPAQPFPRDATAITTFTIPDALTGQTRSLDISPLVRGWADGTFPNFGLTFRRSDGVDFMDISVSAKEDANATKRPKLEVTLLPSPDLLLRNDGPAFADASADIPLVHRDSRGCAFVDLDGDGAPDIAVANRGAPLELYLNDGAGRFRDASAGRLPARALEALDLQAGDLDGDGDQDLVVLVSGGTCLALVNDGSGTFAERTALAPPAPIDLRSARLGDLTGSSLPDIVLVGAGSGTSLVVVQNNGLGPFTNATAAVVPAGLALPSTLEEVAVGDLDADGLPDVIAVGPGGARLLLLRSRRGGFIDATSVLPASFAPPQPVGIVVADLDGNGRGDVFVACGSGRPALLLGRQP